MEYLIGLILGGMLSLSGAGGVIAVPLIMIFLKLPLNDAMGTALGAVMISAAVGVLNQRKAVLFVPALILGLSGMLSAPLGRALAIWMNEWVLLCAFLSISFVIAGLMWKKAVTGTATVKAVSSNSVLEKVISVDVYDRSVLEQAMPVEPNGFKTKKLEYDRALVTKMLVSGLSIGSISGVLGIGGGVFMVPFLRWFLKISIKEAIATSMMTVLLISCSGFLTSFFVYHQVNELVLAKLSVAAIIGILIGQKLGSYCHDAQLQKIFSVSIIFMCFLALAKEL